MNTEFVHLHVHSEYSVCDSIITIKDLLEITSKQGAFAVALTDQANLFAMVKFYLQASKHKIKPLVGADIWIQNIYKPKLPYRLLLLCKNLTGYNNLTKLISKAYLEGQAHGKPVVKLDCLENWNTGLIAIALGRYSDLGQALLADDESYVNELLTKWQTLFPNNFYLGITRTNRCNEEKLIQKAVNLSQQSQLPLVALNEVCFAAKEDFDAHETRICIQEGYTLSDTNRQRNYSDNQYLKSPKVMCDIFSDIPEACANTVEIAKRCNLFLDLYKVHLPHFPIPDNISAADYLIKQAKEGLANRCRILFSKKQQLQPKNNEEVYWERLKIEIDVINSMKFAGYFLIVADFIRWAKKSNIPVGPGRGSGVGSLVAYALNITDLDPLQYDLLFERFLNPERVSMPDFDIDFCMEGRDRVIEYVADTYGRESVAQIITYGTMAAKAVIRDVGRVLNHPYGFVDKIAKAIPFEVGMTLNKALLQEELQKLYKEEVEVKNIIDLAKKLEGIVRNVGKHAGGVVIAPSKLTNFTPLYCEDNYSSIVTQFDKNDIETIGLVKFDFLGLRTLTIINWTIKNINKKRKNINEEPLNINNLVLDDKLTFAKLCKCETIGIFQLESRGMKDLVKRLQPDRFEDIMALVALFRPGPLQSGMVDDYINRRHGAKIEYLHKSIVNILKPTYGIILYQEQVMQIAQVLAGYTLGGADVLRRAMGKKKPEEMAKQRNIFIDGAAKNNIDSQIAEHIFNLIEKFAGYGFNKSHSAAYALITYQTAWLKAHYPEEFMASVLSSDMNNTDKIIIFIDECIDLKINVLPPDINSSFYAFTVNDNKEIVYGLGAIKGIGEGAIESLINIRQTRKIADLFDLCVRIDLKKANKRTLEALIKSGACDELGANRAELLAQLPEAINTAEQLNKNLHSGQQDLFSKTISSQDLKKISAVNIRAWPEQVRLQYEKDTLGIYLTGHPIEQYRAELDSYISCQLKNINQFTNKVVNIAGLIIATRTLLTKRGDKMAFITLDDRTNKLEIAIFPELLTEYRELLNKDNIIIISADVKYIENNMRISAKKIYNLATARQKFTKGLQIVLHSERWQDDWLPELNKLFNKYFVDINDQERGCPMRIIYLKENIKAKFNFKKPQLILPSIELINNLKKLLGENSVQLIYNN